MSDLSVLFEGKTSAEIREGADKVSKLLKAGKIKTDKVSILDLAESMLGHSALRKVRHATEEGVGAVLSEAADPVALKAFNNVTGTLVYQGVVESYQSPDFIGDSLVTAETSSEDYTRKIGVAEIDDDAQIVPEGMEYPDVKMGEDYIDIPQSVKRGMKISLTREALFFDKTGQLLDKARSVGERLGLNKEKRILRTVLGIDNTFKRKGTARNTYVASADPRINKKSGTALVDWTSVDTAMALFTDMRDDRVASEPITVMPKTMIVSQYKLLSARRILNATEIRQQTQTATIETASANPVAGMFNIVSSPWVDALLIASGISSTNAKDYWYLGDFKRAFFYRTLFPLSVRTAAANDQDEFDRDVVAKFRADERGVPYIAAPWFAAQFYNA
jgi:hypothetical protein